MGIGKACHTFKCNICPSSFNRKDHLRRHEKTHNGTRFTCGMCIKTFSYRNALVRHEKIIHPQQPAIRINPNVFPPITATMSSAAETDLWDNNGYSDDLLALTNGSSSLNLSVLGKTPPTAEPISSSVASTSTGTATALNAYTGSSLNMSVPVITPAMAEPINSSIVSTSIKTAAASNASTDQDNEEENQSAGDVYYKIHNEDSGSCSLQIKEESEPQPSTFTSEVKETTETEKRKASTESRATKKMKQNDRLVEILSKRKKLVRELRKIDDDDSIDVFFKSMALTVKQFSLELKIKAKFEILRIVSELEMQNIQLRQMNQDPNNPSFSSYEFPETVSAASPITQLRNLCSESDSFESDGTL